MGFINKTLQQSKKGAILASNKIFKFITTKTGEKMLNFEQSIKEIEKLPEITSQELMAKIILIRCGFAIFGRKEELAEILEPINAKARFFQEQDDFNYNKIEKKAIKIIEESGLNWLRLERDRLRSEKQRKEQEERENAKKAKEQKKQDFLNSLAKLNNFSGAIYTVNKGGKGIFKAFTEFHFSDGSVAKFAKDCADLDGSENFDLLAKEDFWLLDLEEKRKAFGKEMILKRQILIKF